MNLLIGDSLVVLRNLPSASVDSIVTDPPYELGFMGKGWDKTGIANNVEMWREALRILKPGGHLLAFSGSRTYHRMTCAIEDAGFEVRDQIMWLYGSGFPKSKNLDGDWHGWGTALKPAHEPICVARKPLVGTVAQNVLTHGTGALNIEGCRVDGVVYTNPLVRNAPGFQSQGLADQGATGKGRVSEGRWPANVIHDGSDEVLATFPQAGGALAPVSGKEPSSKTTNTFGEFEGRTPNDKRDGGGSAARFFYCAKASRRDRNEGCEHLERKPLHWSSGGQNPGSFQSEGTDKTSPNNHPTVKPTELMRYLCRLVTPPGGLVLDPFMGSGSTGKACALEGFRFIGVDISEEYVAIARARIEKARASKLEQDLVGLV